jgi:VirE N-terminal domain.
MVKCADDTKTRDVSVQKILNGIRTGGERLKGQITEIRNRFEAELAITRGDLQKAKRAVEKLKKDLPAVTWSGRFSYRASGKLLQHSGLLCADLDSLGPELETVRKKLKASPHLFALFLSPTGNGLKAVFRVPADASQHSGTFRAVEAHVKQLTGVRIDESGKDVSRLCFMSYEPQLYHNPNATELDPLPEPEKPKPAFNSSAEVNLSERQRIAGELLGDIDWTSEMSGYPVCPGKHLHTTGDGKRDCKIELDGAPTVHCFHNHCRGILEAINCELRSLIGKAEYAGAGAGSELTSLSALGASEYPATPDDAAYYGLAGDIVRRIEPHTEADPVALLFQLLAAFGNLIGHDHYIVADGARHYLNLYGVLVGQSSKGRKGTSWNHVANLMERVDPEWRRDCVSYGLSSGEGLIWEVRDPIEETKPIREKGRHTGEYETFIANHGESDKRVLIIESEFANVLKVMTREGNTLSPVIRSAWDCGDLKTMVKNSPAKATGAHISIVGHITRDELRRYLTQTESANGFANRFFWLAVKRSKCLPDGGAIYAVNFDDIVVELQAAVSFAKDFVEIRRDPEARKLWHDVYPRLSEAQPGMSGAVIGRAEAQVMRLSAIYALLDKSPLILPQHHEAAMDLWRYCEDSVRWIFGTGTGNKNADRILAALRAAGHKGLTRLQITNEVFNRNVTRFEIDEALRLLHSLKLALRKLEGTATRPAERWFYKPRKNEIYEESKPGDGETGDTSYSSYLSASKNASSAEPDTEAETLVGDKLGVARL